MMNQTIEPAGNVLSVSGQLDPAKMHTELQLPDGHIVRIATALLLREDLAFASESRRDEEVIVIPVIEEELIVGRRTVTTGKVRLEKHTQEYKETLNEPLAVRTFEVERVVLNRPVEIAPPPVRQEGGTTIYSVVEEQLVLTKQLILKEELHVVQRDTERLDIREVTLKRETIEVTRTPVERLTKRPDSPNQE